MFKPTDISTNELIRILLVRLSDPEEIKTVPNIKLYKIWRYLQPYIIDINHRPKKGRKPNVHP